MYIVPIQNIPNQTLNAVLNGLEYRIALRTIRGFTFMSCWVNDEVLFYNQVCTPNNWVNVYNYISINGKFYFSCIDSEYPYYQNFGNTQNLVFLTPEEVESYNNANA